MREISIVMNEIISICTAKDIEFIHPLGDQASVSASQMIIIFCAFECERTAAAKEKSPIEFCWIVKIHGGVEMHHLQNLEFIV